MQTELPAVHIQISLFLECIKYPLSIEKKNLHFFSKNVLHFCKKYPCMQLFSGEELNKLIASVPILIKLYVNIYICM